MDPTRHPLLLQVHIQNATLAGGVAIGSAANLALPPPAALSLGLAAGVLSVLGYARLSPALEARLGVRDTCGVLNLHGLPGVLGGLAAGALAALSPGANAGLLLRHGAAQPLWQAAGAAVAVAAGLVAGGAAGWVVGRVDLAGQSLAEDEVYEDGVYWGEGAGEGHED